MHAFADHCFRCPHRRIGELFGREISLHAPPPGNGRSRKYQRDRTRGVPGRSAEHTSELQSLMRISYAVFCLNKTPKLKKFNSYATHLSDYYIISLPILLNPY